MNIDPSELREERLKHPNEAVKAPGGGSVRPSKSLSVISITALLLGLGLAFFSIASTRSPRPGKENSMTNWLKSALK